VQQPEPQPKMMSQPSAQVPEEGWEEEAEQGVGFEQEGAATQEEESEQEEGAATQEEESEQEEGDSQAEVYCRLEACLHHLAQEGL